jgi:hypothetical protein
VQAALWFYIYWIRFVPSRSSAFDLEARHMPPIGRQPAVGETQKSLAREMFDPMATPSYWETKRGQSNGLNPVRITEKSELRQIQACCTADDPSQLGQGQGQDYIDARCRWGLADRESFAVDEVRSRPPAHCRCVQTDARPTNAGATAVCACHRSTAQRESALFSSQVFFPLAWPLNANLVA